MLSFEQAALRHPALTFIRVTCDLKERRRRGGEVKYTLMKVESMHKVRVPNYFN